MRYFLIVASLFTTVIVILLVEMAGILNPTLIFMMVSVYFAFASGILAGSISAAVTIGYMTCFFSVPGQFLHFTPDNFKRITLVWVSMPLVVLMVGILKQRLEVKTRKLAKQERKLADQLRLAGEVQKMMLQGDYGDPRISVQTLYGPAQVVSGDYYLYAWAKSGKVFNGCLIDITGHGVATALQTAAVSSVVSEEMQREEYWSVDLMQKLNTILSNYLTEENFAAVIGFSLDFEKSVLTCLSGGINFFLSSSSGWVKLPGSYLGLLPDASFDMVSLPFHPGDSFYFMTDGLTDKLVNNNGMFMAGDFAETVNKLRVIVSDPIRKDDCTAVCLKIR